MKRDIFQAIADPTRRAILLLIASQAMTPNAVAENFNSTRQAVSKHIKILAESDLLMQEKVGREIYYHLNPMRIQEIDMWIQQFKGILEKRFDQLDEVLLTIKNNKK